MPILKSSRVTCLFLCSILVLAATAARAEASGGVAFSSSVLPLDDQTFDSRVQGEPSNWLLFFHHQQCAKCQQVAPDFSRAADKLRGIVKSAHVDCGSHPRTCTQAAVKTFPAVRLFSWEVKTNPYTNTAYKDAPLVYDGDYKSKSLINFVTASLPSTFIHNISSLDEVQKFVREIAQTKVLHITATGSTTARFKALSARLSDRLAFAHYHRTKSTTTSTTNGDSASASASSSGNVEESIADQLQAVKAPAYVVIQPDGSLTHYSGKDDALLLSKWVEGYYASAAAAATGSDNSSSSGGSGGSGGSGRGPGRRQWVQPLSSTEFDGKVMEREEMWVVAVVDSTASGCSDVISTWEDKAEQLFGMLMTAVMDVASDPGAKDLAVKFGISDACGAALLFPFGRSEKEDSPPTILPLSLSSRELVSAVYEAAPSSLVRFLEDAELSEFMQAHPAKLKVLLFTTKTEVPGLFKMLSVTFRHDAFFAQVHESQSGVLSQFKVQRLPHVSIVFPEDTIEGPGSGKVMLKVKDVSGPFKFRPLAEIIVQLSYSAKQLSVPDVDIQELGDNPHLFKERCVETGRLCIIALLKSDSLLEQFHAMAVTHLHNYQQQQRQQQQGVHPSTPSPSDSSQFSFFWFNAAKHSAAAVSLLPLFALLPSNLPTAVAVSPVKRRAAVMSEEWGPQQMEGFLNGLLAGTVRTFQLSDMPSFEAPAGTAAAGGGWAMAGDGAADGEQQQQQQQEEVEEEAVVEEEFDLADIMSEQVEDASVVASKEERMKEADMEMEEQERLAKEEAKAKTTSKKKKKKGKKKSKGSDLKDEL